MTKVPDRNRKPRPNLTYTFSDEWLSLLKPTPETLARARDDRKQLHDKYAYDLYSDTALQHKRSKTLLQVRVLPTTPPDRQLMVRARDGALGKMGPLMVSRVGEMRIAVVRGVALMTWLMAALEVEKPVIGGDVLRLRSWAKRACGGGFFTAGLPPWTVADLLQRLERYDGTHDAVKLYLNPFDQIDWSKLFSIKRPESAMIQVKPSRPQDDKPFYIDELRA